MEKITKDMLVGDILRANMKLEDTFIDNGMFCIGCPSSQMESLESACMVHGLDCETILNNLNKALEAINE